MTVTAGPSVATLGIDLASQPANTAACLIVWTSQGATVPYLACGADDLGPLDDARLVALMTGDAGLGPAPVKIGIDAPLGWPRAFVTALADPLAWPLEEEVPLAQLVRRRTDHWIHQQTGKVPLSVSTDRIAYPAMRALRLLRRLQQATGVPVDRSGVTGPVAEVYPDTGVTAFDLREPGRRRSYKAADGAAVRAGLLTRLADVAPWLSLTSAQQAVCVARDDSFDAVIAALLARCVERGLTEPPPPGAEPEAESEGWIHLPVRGALDRLIAVA